MSQQQPADQVNYPYNPNAYPSTPTQPSSSHSNGSFAPVLIVLAILLVVTTVAVVVGRCGYPKGGGKKSTSGGGKKKGKGGGVAAGRLSNGKQFQENDDGDIEFGFGGKKIPTSKVANGNFGPGGGVGPMMPQRSDPRGPRIVMMPQSGGGGSGNGGSGSGGERGQHVRFGDHNDIINSAQFHPGS